MVVKQLDVSRSRLNVSMTTGQGNMRHGCFRQGLLENDVGSIPTYAQWKIRFIETASAIRGLDKEDPLHTVSSQRMSTVCCWYPGLTVRVWRTSRYPDLEPTTVYVPGRSSSCWL